MFDCVTHTPTTKLSNGRQNPSRCVCWNFSEETSPRSPKQVYRSGTGPKFVTRLSVLQKSQLRNNTKTVQSRWSKLLVKHWFDTPYTRYACIAHHRLSADLLVRGLGFNPICQYICIQMVWPPTTPPLLEIPQPKGLLHWCLPYCQSRKVMLTAKNRMLNKQMEVIT